PPGATVGAGLACGHGTAVDGAPLPRGSPARAARYATARATLGRAPQLRWAGAARPPVCAPRFAALPAVLLSSADPPEAGQSGGAAAQTACPCGAAAR